MPHLFSPIRIGHLRLANRLALQALPSGCAVPGGMVTRELAAYYRERAQGVGLVVLEATYVVPPRDSLTPHIGLYADAQLFALAHCINGIHRAGATALVMLDQPLWMAHASVAKLDTIGAAFVAAAQRARTAGADGVMFSTADGGPMEQLVSPLQNQRTDQYGGSIGSRLRFLTDIVELIRRRVGPDFVMGARLNAEEFAPGGLDMQESRLIATLLLSSGLALIEVGATKPHDALVAQFPGWQLPFAEGVKAVVDAPVMVGGLLDEPQLAESAIRDKSADLIAIGERLKHDPAWPERARSVLT